MANSPTSQTQSPGFLRGAIVQTGPDTIEPPKNIIQTVQAAKTIYYNYRAEHLRRIDLSATIEGLFAGNPPYNPAELARNKLSHISNFNDLSARALYEKKALSFWNLLNEAETLCKFTLRIPSTDQSVIKNWEAILAKHWNTVVRSWDSFHIVFNTLSAQLVKLGVSPVLWPDERDWRWRVVEYPRFFVEDQAQSDVDYLTAVCVETNFTAQFLFQVYETFKGKPESEHPWNLQELSSLLVFLANNFAKTDFQFMDMMDIQKRVQNGDLTYSAIFSDNIRIVSLLYKEYDGKVSHYMFHPRFDQGNFLYFADRQYKSIQDALVIFTASPGEFTIHSNRGLGHKILSSSQALMQLNCSMVDMGKMSTTPLIKSPATGSKDFEAIRFYPGVATNIGMCEFQENTLGENIDQVINVSGYIERKIEKNNFSSGDDPSVPDMSQGSVAPETDKRGSFREFTVLKQYIAHFYTNMDRVFRNMTVKMLASKKSDPGYDYVARWKELCIEDGVPESLFSTRVVDQFGMPKGMAIKATRVAGDGSTLARLMGLDELAPYVSEFGPKGRQLYLKERVMVAYGLDYVEAFLGDSEIKEDGDSLAGLENTVMRLGEAATFSFSNPHQEHFVTHMALGEDTIQRIQQQQLSAVDADKVFVQLIPHMNDHFQVLARSVVHKSFVDSVKKPWAQLQQYATLNHHNAANELQAQIRKQQEQQAATQQVLTDEQIKNLKAQGDEKRADFKVQSQVQRAQEANATRAGVMREKVQADAANDRLKISLEHSKDSLDTRRQNLENAPLDTLRSDLADINGRTVAPYDLET